MKNLFYSPSEKIAFWVAGYCEDLNTDNVVSKTRSLLENGQSFAAHLGIELKSVNTYEILKSQRYRNMRLFYANGVDSAPDGSFVITNENGWTMSEWVHGG